MSNYFTQEGLELRRQQIKAQQEKVRAIGKEAGEEAGMNCDWHDNFGYEDAKRRLEMESGILQKMLEESSGAQIVDIEEQNNIVAIGVTVELLINGDRKVFTIGAFGESDPANGLISYNTPLARPLLKMEVGDSKTFNIAGKQAKVEIEEIYPPSYLYRQLISKLISSALPT
jgi:transcription elongation GreA/GreB family factor